LPSTLSSPGLSGLTTFIISFTDILDTVSPDCRGAIQATKKIRVLVIEDEALVGMMIEDFLGDFGYSVVGPIENLEAAVFLAATEHIDVAVVDINISGQVATPWLTN
jgi:response regulator RpfG family c-di-GMP phosphodiesterase